VLDHLKLPHEQSSTKPTQAGACSEHEAEVLAWGGSNETLTRFHLIETNSRDVATLELITVSVETVQGHLDLLIIVNGIDGFKWPPCFRHGAPSAVDAEEGH